MSKHASYESGSLPAWKLGLKVFGYSILAGITGLFLYFSLTMLTDAALQKPVAYRIMTVQDDGSVTVEEIPWAEYEAMDAEELTVTDDSRVSGEVIMAPINATCAVLLTVVRVIEQLLMIAILVVLTGYYVHAEGDRDRNLVKHHEREATPFKGLQAGLIASIPGLFLFGMLVAGKTGVMAESVQGLYRLLQPCFLPLVNILMPTAMYPATAIPFGTFAGLFGLWMILPASSAAAYYMGYKRMLKKRKKKK